MTGTLTQLNDRWLADLKAWVNCKPGSPEHYLGMKKLDESRKQLTQAVLSLPVKKP